MPHSIILPPRHIDTLNKKGHLSQPVGPWPVGQAAPRAWSSPAVGPWWWASGTPVHAHQSIGGYTKSSAFEATMVAETRVCGDKGLWSHTCMGGTPRLGRLDEGEG